jgi:Methyltransferase domain
MMAATVNFRKNWNSVEDLKGWISYTDSLIIQTLLWLQNSHGVDGDLMEIGVYEGKTAILIASYLKNDEEFHACDVFDSKISSVDNFLEVINSYPGGVSQKRFETNFAKIIKRRPHMHVCESSELHEKMFLSNFRFIHIDGSHLYDSVKSDSEFGIKMLLDSDAFLVFDDYREMHGTAINYVIFDLMKSKIIHPIIFSANKAYFVSNPNVLTLDKIFRQLNETGVTTELVSFDRIEFLRVTKAVLRSKRNFRDIAKMLIPPVILKVARNLMNIRRLIERREGRV